MHWCEPPANTKEFAHLSHKGIGRNTSKEFLQSEIRFPKIQAARCYRPSSQDTCSQCLYCTCITDASNNFFFADSSSLSPASNLSAADLSAVSPPDRFSSEVAQDIILDQRLMSASLRET